MPLPFACYDLCNPVASPLFSTGGSIKSVHRVEAGGQTYILKRYDPDFRSFADVAAMHAAQDYLSQRAIPVARVVPNREGQRFTQTEDGIWVLYAQAPGRHLRGGRDMPPAAAANLGATVGGIIRELADWKSDWTPPEHSEVVSAEEGIPRFETLLRLAEQDKSPVGELCVRSLRYRIGALERLADFARQVLAMEQQWVHGDVNDGNIFFVGDRVSAVIDFDNMRRAPRGFDFMYGLNGCFERGAPEQADYARAYLRLVRPPETEVALYAPLWTLRQLCDIWPMSQKYLHPETYNPAWTIDPPEEWLEPEIDATTEWLLNQANEG